MDYPLISVIIPCRNEEDYVEKCIESVLACDYPKDKMEIIISDGMSTDKTRQILADYQNKYSFIKVIDNPKYIVPTAMNLAILQAKGEYIVRLDMHSIYPQNYISTLINFHLKHKCSNVGAACLTMPANDSNKARSIAIAISSKFGVGNSEYRTGINETREYFETDAVPFGCYPKEIFEKYGLYDEQLVRNQDDELNERIIKGGEKMYLIPSLKITYFSRENFKKVFKMMYQYGYFGPLVSLKLQAKRRLRKYVPAVFVLSLVVPLLLSLIHPLFAVLTLCSFLPYVSLGLFMTILECKKQNEKSLIPLVLWGSIVSHIGYGLGTLKGFLDFNILKKHNKEIVVKSSR